MNIEEIIKPTPEEQLAKIDTAINARRSVLASLQSEFEQQTAGLTSEIEQLEEARRQLVPQEIDVPTEEQPSEDQSPEEDVEG